jgi:Ni/Co efflux regulator RcnB
MKRVLVILVAAALAISPSLASQTDPTREELRQTVQHIQRLAKEQQVELDAAHENEKTLQGKLTATLGALGTAQSSLITVQGKINLLAQHDANETAAKAHILAKYHFLKAIACAIAAAAAIFAVMQLTSFIPLAIMPYKIYLYAGAGLGAAILVATLL